MCSGLYVEAISEENTTTKGEKIKINFQVSNRLNTDVQLLKIQLPAFDTIINKKLELNKNQVFVTNYLISDSIQLTNPYWLEKKLDKGSFNVENQLLIGQSENKASINAEFSFLINGKELKINRPIVYRITDPVKGEIIKPLEVVPALSVNFIDKSVLLTSSLEKEIELSIKSGKANMKGELMLKVPKGYSINPISIPFNIIKKGDEQQIVFKIKSDLEKVEAGKITAEVKIDNLIYNQSVKHVIYDHIPQQIIIELAEASISKTDLLSTSKNIGYITGAEDAIPEALKNIGLTVTILSDEQLINGDLSKYDAIISGIRAFNTNERMSYYHSNLMKYVENGGIFLVQYNTNNFIGSVKTEMGPHPMKLGRERVTDENAKVILLDPKHPIFNYPNKITDQDFEGWIQERSLYHASEWDKNYIPLLRMNDKNEKPSDGSLLIADYGKGRFIYTGLSFFRELPAGVPGAFRLFVNLINKEN